MSKNVLIVLLALLGVGSGAAVWWTQHTTAVPPEPAPVPTAEDEDTGMTRFETEELMRTIGYTQ